MKYVTKTYELKDTYKKILINAKDADVKIESSDDDGTKLVFLENKKMRNINFSFSILNIFNAFYYV